MRIGLASFLCKNKDISFNLSQIERAMRQVRGKADLVCFGEAYLQGFDCLCWDYHTDKDMAVEIGSEPIRRLCQWTREYGVALITGYIEKERDSLYSSCIALEDGRVLCNYRRISRGWKEYWRTDEHYKEGDSIEEFDFHGSKITLSLCGDLWDYPERFKTDHLIVWPVSVNFSPEEWERNELEEYAKQAALASDCVLMINPLDDTPTHGGSVYFHGGRVTGRLAFDREDILIVEIDP